MRLFTALDPPDALRTKAAQLRAPDALDARWSSPDQYHVTLRFLGEVGSDRAARYDTALAEVDAAPPECCPYGLDVLPSRRHPSVLILGLDRTDSLLALYESVSTALEAEGLDPEERTYRPHLTLARLNDVPAETVHRFLDRHDAGDLPSFRPDRFHLYESTLTPDGAVHDRRASYSLAEAGAPPP
ncbi:MAG: RNA 2',3'-cyclic phosphodiesterase [Salinivenus sp.]